MHSVGNQSAEIAAKLNLYERWLEQLLSVTGQHYAETRLHIFSDHGMANCDQLLDLKGKIDALPLIMAEDYAVVYDSTMARFWFFNDYARQQVTQCLNHVQEGRIVPDSELADLGALFADRYFGELIFVVKEGVLIVPSHMGKRPIRGMHGYHPSEKQSYAVLCTYQDKIPEDISAIPDIYRLMTRDAEDANARNSLGKATPQQAIKSQQFHTQPTKCNPPVEA